jgi:TatD DNase family protein
MLFDSHCHLDSKAFGSDEEVDDVVQRALDSGVVRLLAIGSGYGLGAMERAVAVADRHAAVYASVGVHPHDSKLWSREAVERIRLLAGQDKVLAIGEMGLDYHYDLSPRDVQRRVFREQIALALELKLPIIVHDRDTEGECLAILEEEGAFDVGVLFHCYCGDVEQMEAIVALGGLISIPGIVTFKRSEAMRTVVEVAPLESMLIETDSPFLTPVPHRGSRNEPMRVGLVCKAISEIKAIPEQDVARVTTRSACRFFGLNL